MNEAELQGELEMLEAMYSDSFTITKTSLENLHRHGSFNNDDDDDANGNTSSSSSSSRRKQRHEQDDASSTHFLIGLVLRNRVSIEVTVPRAGYGPGAGEDVRKIRSRIRCYVLQSPNAVDSDDLLDAMTRPIAESMSSGEDPNSLLIYIFQAAEQFVETCLADNAANNNNNNNNNTTNTPTSSTSSSSDKNNNNNSSGEYGEDGGEGLLHQDDKEASTSSGMFFSATTTRSESGMIPSSVSGGGAASAAGTSSSMMMSSIQQGLLPDTEAGCAAELASRKVVRIANPIVDRKSKFLAHCAPIRSEHDALIVVALLRELKSIASACHPAIYAYRFTNPATNVVHYDCEDDGEKNAAKNILFVMEQMNVDGWVVVVTRYYGGVNLGGDRFRHICAVTRSVLLEADAATAKKGSNNSPSGKKK